MPQPKLSQKQLQEAIDAFHTTGSKVDAAKLLGLNPRTYDGRYRVAENKGIKPTVPELKVQDGIDLMAELKEAKAKIRTLETAADAQAKEQLTAEFIKKKIIQLKDENVDVPDWLIRAPKDEVSGVPTLFASDWHWAEIVDPKQIGGVNQYNITISQQRARALIETAIDLLNNHLKNPEYPGIVFALGGDMVSGDIHEELMATNEVEIMPTVLDLFGVLTWCITTLADQFGKVFVPCVTGNHGRNTHKIRAKGRNFTSFDWLLYSFLAKRFEADERVKFLIPDGPDAYYSIFGHKYLLTHGDQFRGGDGMIGALGPIIRGDHRKRSRNAQIDQDYDTMLLGHWHQLIQLQRLIVNGSLKGYDEYANQNNFPYEPPRQALWITHPQHGITFSAPVNVERKRVVGRTEWVSWTK
jgi:hypothetical protein